MLPNLNALFRDDDDVKAKIKSLFSLAFLDVPFVYEHFCLLMKTFPEIPLSVWIFGMFQHGK
jgi:hypothetical protein